MVRSRSPARATWRIAIAGLLLLCPAASTAASYHDTWRWRHLSLSVTPSAEPALFVSEASDSTLWVGTRRGVAWFDGFRFVRPGPDLGVPERPIRLLRALDGGRMAFTSDGDLFVGDRAGFSRVPLPFEIDYMARTDDGAIGLLSEDSQLFLLRGEDLRPLAPPEGVAAADIAGLHQGGGALWLRLTTGVYRLENERWIPEQFDRDLQHLAVTRDGRRYGAAVLPIADRGLWSWTPGTEPVHQTEGVQDLIRLTVTDGERLLVIYESGAVVANTPDGWQRLEPVPEPMRDIVHATFRRNGDLVLATGDGLQLFRAGGREWRRWHTPGGGARNRVDEILETDDGDIWLGTDSGVEVHHRDGRVTWFAEALGQPLRIVTALGEDDAGGIWVGSGAFWDGAFRYFEGRWTFHGPEEGLHASRVHRIHRGPDGTLYFLGLARDTGAYRTLPAAIGTYRDGHFGKLDLEQRFGDERVHGMSWAPDGTLWLCGARGIARRREGTWTYWSEAEGLQSSAVFTIAAARDGRVFFADRANGLGQIDAAGKVSYRTTQDGLLHDQIWDLEVDHEGSLWMATRGGLSCLRDGMWLNFGAGSGLTALELWPVAATRSGIIVGSAGKGAFHLDLHHPWPPPRIALEPALVTRERVVIRWQVRSFEGETPPDRIQTRLSLDGGPWSSWEIRNEAVLSGLDAGAHRIRLQAAGQRGDYDRTGASLEFQVPDRLVSRPAFYLPVGTSLAAAIVLALTLVLRRRRYAAALVASESRYSSFFRQAPISLWEQDYSEVKSYLDGLSLPDEAALRDLLTSSPGALMECTRRIHILDANDATLELFECADRETLSGQSPRIFRREAREAFIEAALALYRGDARFRHETTAYTLTDTRLRVILSWVAAPGAEDDYARVLVSVLDITPQRQAAEELRKAVDAAEEASRAKSAFLANTSHEIRTPINAVMGMAQALQEEGLPPAAAEQVDTILSASESLAAVIDDLLDLSKIEAGQLELDPVPFDPVEVVSLAYRTLAPRAERKGIALRIDVAPDTVRHVEGDVTRVRQVLLNLIGNAVKFTDHGAVDVRLRSSRDGDGLRLHVEIEDSGIGIAADRIEDIFEPFTQSDASITRTHGGTGLGLSISRRLVEQMDGRLTVVSELGQGSSFGFDIRVGASSGAPATAAPMEVAPTPRLRILVVEDNDLNRKVVRALLRRDEHEIIEAADGVEAVDAARQQDFDVILMDMQMPVMDGLTATRQIRQMETEHGRRRVPIVAVTANAMRADRDRCLAAGMDDFLAKPVRREQLRAVLASVVGAAAVVGPADTVAAAEPITDLPVLDAGVLDGLRDLADEDEEFTISGFIRLFLSETPRCLQRARAALAAGDRSALHREVHTIKGSSREMGGVDLGARAEALEQAIRHAQPVDVEAGLQDLEERLSRLAEVLRAMADAEDAGPASS